MLTNNKLKYNKNGATAVRNHTHDCDHASSLDDFKIIGLAHGPLVGFQYIDKEHEDDWNEFNIYLVISLFVHVLSFFFNLVCGFRSLFRVVLCVFH